MFALCTSDPNQVPQTPRTTPSKTRKKLLQSARLPFDRGTPTQLLLPLLRPGGVGIDAALDFREALVMAVNHPGDRDRAADEDGADRNQQSSQTEDGIDQSVH